MTPAFVALFALLVQDAPTPEAVGEGEHFQVVCHFEDSQVATQAALAAETTWPILVELLDLKKAALDKPLVVHLYPDAKSYEEAEQALTGGRFKQNLSFSSHATGEAHVALQPALAEDARAQIGAPAATLRLVAHEAAHIATYRLLANHESHPDWLAEGIATWVEGRAMVVLGLAAAPDEEPFTSTQVVRCQRMAEQKTLPSASAILKKPLEGLEFHDAYAVHSLFFRFLQEKRGDATSKAVVRVAKLDAGDDFEKRLAAELEKIYGKGFTKLDEEFRAWIPTLQPAWEEVFRSLETGGDAWTQTAFDKNAIAWRTQAIGKLPWELRGVGKVLGGTPQMNVLVDRGPAGFLSVTFRAENEGSISVLEYDAAADSWKTIGTAEKAGIELGREFPFLVSVNNSKRLRVEVGEGEKASELVVDVSQRECTGAWGLGVQASGAGVWRRVRLGR